jgi:transcriptional regulator with XRE-family HTH domain
MVDRVTMEAYCLHLATSTRSLMRQRNPYQVKDREALQKRLSESQRVVPHSVRSLARLAGVAPATVGHLLTGERNRASLAVAQRLSAALGVPMEDLFVPTTSTSCDSAKEVEA